MPIDWTIMDDIEEMMFWDCPKDEWDKYVMPDDYCCWSHIDDQIMEMDDETIKKLVDDYGIFKVVKEFYEEKGYYAFDDDVVEKNDTVVYRILAEFIITQWIEDMEIVSDFNMTEYEEYMEEKEVPLLYDDSAFAWML